MFEKHLIVMPEQTFQKKEEVLKYLTHLDNARVLDPNGYEADVLDREDSFPTYIFEGIAIPHAKTEHVSEPFVVYARLRQPVPWGEDEDENADQIFLLGVPKSGKDESFANLHLKILNQLSKNLMHEDFREGLRAADSAEEIYQMLKKIEEGFNK